MINEQLSNYFVIVLLSHSYYIAGGIYFLFFFFTSINDNKIAIIRLYKFLIKMVYLVGFLYRVNMADWHFSVFWRALN